MYCLLVHCILINYFFSRVAEAVSSNEVSLIAHRKKSLIHLKYDIINHTIGSIENILTETDELSMFALHSAQKIVAYVESWSNLSTGRIKLIKLSDNNSIHSINVYKNNVIIDESITSIAFDTITNKIYIGIETASINNCGRIEICKWNVESYGNVSDSNGHAGSRKSNISNKCAVLLYASFNNQVDSFHSLTLDPMHGYMYWLNRMHKRIERAWMDGQHHDLHPFKEDTTDIVATSALTLDNESRSLYFIRTKLLLENSQILRCILYDRESCEVVASSVNAFHMDVFSDLLLWTSVSSYTSGIMICDKSNCDETIRSIPNSTSIEAFRILNVNAAHFSQLVSSRNPCRINNGGCSHFCVLIPGVIRRSCLCPVGVRLLKDGLTCANGISSALLVATLSGLVFISLDTSDFTPLTLSNNFSYFSETKVLDVGYDPVEEQIYFISGEEGSIRRCAFDGTQLEDFCVNVVTARSIALELDVFNRNLYWIDTNTREIKMKSLNGGHEHLVIIRNLKQLADFLVDSLNGYIYFTDSSYGKNFIEKAWLDGTHRATLVKLKNDFVPSSIVIDIEGSKLYWTDSQKSLINSVNLDGSDVRTFSNEIGHPYSLSILGNFIYCNSLYGRTISALPLPRSVLHLTSSVIGHSIVSDSVIFGQIAIRAIQLDEIALNETHCQRNNGNCSHICLKTPTGKSECVCPDSFELQVDNKTCVLPSAFLIYISSPKARRSSIMRVSLENALATERLISIANATSFMTIAVDQSRQRILWVSDDRERSMQTLFSSFFNGTDVQLVLKSSSITCLSLEWTSGNIYWCNAKRESIEITRWDGRYRRVIAWENVVPSHLAVHPILNFFVFANSINSGKLSINKCPLEGCRTGGEVIISNVGRIGSLVIDFDSNRLAWSTIYDGISRIYTSNFDGADRLEIFRSAAVVPFTFAVHEKMIYWANHRMNSIDVFDGKSTRTLHSNILHVSFLTIAVHGYTKSLNKCAENNGNCEGICIPAFTRENIICHCETHFTFDVNRKICLPPERFFIVAIHDQLLRFNLIRLTANDDLLWKADPYVTLSIDNVGVPLSISIDSLHRKIYWIDSRDDKHIKRSSDLSNSDTVPISLAHNSGCSILFSLVVDVFGRQLFVSCAELGLSFASSIHVWRIKNDDRLEYIGVVVSGRDRSTVTAERPSNPRQIAIFPRLNLLFYVDVGDKLPTVIRCQLNGRKCAVWLVSNVLHPFKIYANLVNERLYYTTSNGLWSRDAHVFGDVRHHLRLSPSGLDMIHLNEKEFIVTIWNDAHGDMMFRMHENTPTLSLEQLRENHSDNLTMPKILVSAVGASSDFTFAGDLCSQSYCSHICHIPRNFYGSYECLCPLGYGMQSAGDSTCFRHVICEKWQFRCDDGQQCIHYSAKCDGVSHCNDFSDESQMLCRGLEVGSWICDDGKESIVRNLFCDGKEDCADGSDEAHCHCPDPFSHFDCSVSLHALSEKLECISRSLLCDNIVHCSNGADEMSLFCGKSLSVTQSPRFQSFEFLLPLIIFFLIFSVIVLACCVHINSRKAYTQQNSVSASVPIKSNGEVRVLLPTHPYGAHVEVQLRTFSVENSSICSPLPPPILPKSKYVLRNNSRTSYFSSSSKSNTLNFFAPPPSAASLSTYGIVNPVGIKTRVGYRSLGNYSRKAQRKARNRSRTLHKPICPPPSYVQASTYRLSVGNHHFNGVRAPVNSRIVSTAGSLSSSVENSFVKEDTPSSLSSSSCHELQCIDLD